MQDKIRGRIPAMAAAAMLLGVAMPAIAQPAAAPAGQAASGFAIAPQPLGAALAQFSRATGLQASAPAALLEGRRSPGASGNLSAPEALRRLLAGTGLAGRIEGGAILLTPEPRAAAGDMVLPTVDVGASTGGGRWPSRGFVAEASAAGTKTDTPLIETPQAMNVVTRAEIEAQGSTSITDALRYTPGVISQYGATDLRYDWFTVRGFTPPVRYLDGLRLPFGARGYSQPRIEPFGLERIELLKGPASALYGQSSPGGLLNMVSRRPSQVAQNEVILQYGSHDALTAGFDSTGPLDAEGKFSYRLTALGRRADSQTQFLDERRIFVAPSLTWRPDAQTSLTVLAQYQRITSDGGGAPQALPVQGTLWANPNGRISTRRSLTEPGYDRYTGEQIMLGYAFEHRFDSVWQVRQNFRYSHVDSDSQRVQAYAFAANQRDVGRYAWGFPEISDAFTVDNQAQADFTTGPVRHRLLTGFDYQREDATYEESQLTLLRALDVFNPVYGLAVTRPPMANRISQGRNQAGLYAQDELRFDRFILTLGGRYDWATARTNNYTVASRTTSVIKQDDGEFTGRVGLVYRFDNGLAPYASVSTSFQPTAGTDRRGAPFDATKGRQYEVGLRYQPEGSGIFAAVSAFHLTQENVLTPDPLDTRYSAQAGEAESRGIELEAKASLAERLNLSLSYAYTETEVTRANRNAAGTSTLGKQLPFAPNHQAAAWLDYTFNEPVVAGLGVGGGVRYIGASYGDANNLYRANAATLVDLALRYELGQSLPSLQGAQLGLNVLNLFDKEYVSTCISATGCYWGARRTVLATLKYRW
ncbi:TonB-dependent siderophore receptor [Teichococcus deserti]|nr:TonB-dependent siderophore receptor [Pseudoroseomonas deserti]